MKYCNFATLIDPYSVDASKLVTDLMPIANKVKYCNFATLIDPYSVDASKLVTDLMPIANK